MQWITQLVFLILLHWIVIYQCVQYTLIDAFYSNVKLLVFYFIPPILKVDSAWGCAQGKVSKIVDPQSCFNRAKSTILAALFLSRFHLLGKMGT